MLKDGNKIIESLGDKGFKSYLVGGCVRDSLMNRPLTDIDITTAATPDQVMEIFSAEEVYTVPTGLEHGTVTIVVNGNNIEVSTFRTDITSDGRRSEVRFGNTLEEDLLRRDFTMNAIAYSPIDDAYIDPFDGQEDIKLGLIRAVGTPVKRFREDYLRMIRAHRFEATLEFQIEPETYMALKETVDEKWQQAISIERIRDEINKCLKWAEKPSLMIEGMRRSGILESVIPELMRCCDFEQNKYHEFDLYIHTLRTLDAVPREFYLIRWAALFHDLGKVDTCEHYGPDATFYGHEKISVEAGRKIMKRLKFSKASMDHVLNLVKYHMYGYSEEMGDAAVRRFVAAVGKENVEDLCILRLADRMAKSDKLSYDDETNQRAVLRRLDRMAADNKVFKIKDLAIGGRDIMEIKKIPGSPRVGEILCQLHEIVLDDPTKNTMDTLRKVVEEI